MVNIVTELPSIHQGRVLQARREAEQAMIVALDADGGSAEIKEFICFCVLIGLSEVQIRERLPGAMEFCDVGNMPAELRRLHIERMNRPCLEDRQKL